VLEFHVLLRHRPRSIPQAQESALGLLRQPGGVEGRRPVPVVKDVDDLVVPQRAARSLTRFLQRGQVFLGTDRRRWDTRKQRFSTAQEPA
jgi:hypothetical protein